MRMPRGEKLRGFFYKNCGSPRKHFLEGEIIFLQGYESRSARACCN